MKQLRGFLGLSGYYRKFIQGYGVLSRPLSDLLKKNVPFIWTPTHQAAFDSLKKALISAPVLQMPDFSRSFTIETDASNAGIGAVLTQQGHPIAYLSKALGPRARAMSTYENECLAILLAVEKWRSYLQHKEFTIATDHKSLTHLGEHKIHQGMQHKAFLKLMGLQYRVVYKKGLENKAADSLSRQSPPLELSAISASKPRWLEIITEGYNKDPHTQQLLTELSITGYNDQGFTLADGLIRFKGKIWLGSHVVAHQAVLLALHSSGLGGHSGMTATYQKVKALFAWPHMKQDIRNYVAACSVCKQAKVEHTRTPGTLQPLPIPTQAWTIISLDFVEGLPKSQQFDTILVVIDKFTKYGHFIPMSHPFTALTVAQLFINHVYKLHGLPQIIISDRDRVFTSSLWQELFKLTDTTLNMSSSYHPQTDGQTERLNQCLETYLRCMVHACPKKWSHWLALAEFWYNTTFHSALGKSPFEVLYGHSPRHFGIMATDQCSSQDLAQWLSDRSLMQQVIRDNLQRAQHRMKQQADKHRLEREFAVGDWVYLKLQPYVQLSVARRTNQKLSFKYFGPYLVLQRVGKVAYKLQLPADSHVHPVVHVSQLKKALPPDTVVNPDSVLLMLASDKVFEPMKLLRSELRKVGGATVPFALVRWAHLPDEWATWEKLHDIQMSSSAATA